MVKYPEHDKLRAMCKDSQLLHNFLEFAAERDVHLSRYANEHELDTMSQRDEDALLAEFTGVDMNKVEEEKRAMIEELQ